MSSSNADTSIPWAWYWSLLIPVSCLLCMAAIYGVAHGFHWTVSDYIDVQVPYFHAANDLMRVVPDSVLENVTLMGDSWVSILLASPVLLVSRRAFFAIFGSIPLGGFFSGYLKHLFAVPRPANYLDTHEFRIVGDVLHGMNSLPSGHAISCFTIVIAMLASMSQTRSGTIRFRVVIPVLLLTLVISLSRVAVGAHWPGDVLAGACFGWIAGVSGVYLTYRYNGWWRWCLGATGSVVIAGCLFVWSLCLFYRWTTLDNDAIVGIAMITGLVTTFNLGIPNFKKLTIWQQKSGT